MQASRIVAAVIAVGIAAGSAYAINGGAGHSAPREMVCSDRHLAMPDQEDCRVQMKAADSEIAKQQIATRFQSKIDQRVAERASALRAPEPEAKVVPPTDPKIATHTDHSTGSVVK